MMKYVELSERGRFTDSKYYVLDEPITITLSGCSFEVKYLFAKAVSVFNHSLRTILFAADEFGNFGWYILYEVDGNGIHDNRIVDEFLASVVD